MMGQVPPKQQEELMKAIDQMQVRDRYDPLYTCIVTKRFRS